MLMFPAAAADADGRSEDWSYQNWGQEWRIRGSIRVTISLKISRLSLLQKHRKWYSFLNYSVTPIRTISDNNGWGKPKELWWSDQSWYYTMFFSDYLTTLRVHWSCSSCILMPADIIRAIYATANDRYNVFHLSSPLGKKGNYSRSRSDDLNSLHFANGLQRR